MTEKEKMEKGIWYDANFDQELVQERLRAEEFYYEFNKAKQGSKKQKEALEKLLNCKLPEGLEILAPVYFDYGRYTHFGKGVFVNHECYFMDGGGIFIGDHVFFGPYCGLYTATHPLQYKERNEGLEKALPIHIGDNCWFGANVSVMPGVTIGSGCVIAAGSIVTKNIPDNSLAAGVPAEVKKTIEQNKKLNLNS